MIREAGGSLALLFAAIVASVLRPLPLPIREDATAPAPRLGRVHAARVVELHLGAFSGPVVGRAHPGAKVDVEPVDETHVRVAMPLAWSKDKEERIWFYAEAAGFTRSLVKEVPPVFPASSRLVRNVSANQLSVEVGSRETFATTVCGEVHLLESSNYEDRSRVSQVIGNIELEGWTWDPAISNPMACIVTRQVIPRDGAYLLRGGATDAEERTVDAIPPGWVTWDRPSAVVGKIAPGLTVYWLTQRPDGTGKCHEWRIEKDVREEEGRTMSIVRKEPLLYDGKRAYELFSLHVWNDTPLERRGLVLGGPDYTATPLGKSVGGYRCGIWYRAVGLTDGVLRVARGVELSASAWSPDDEERWYPTRDACDAARATLDAAIAKDRNAKPPGGIHEDCFGVWGEKDED